MGQKLCTFKIENWNISCTTQERISTLFGIWQVLDNGYPLTLLSYNSIAAVNFKRKRETDVSTLWGRIYVTMICLISNKIYGNVQAYLTNTIFGFNNMGFEKCHNCPACWIFNYHQIVLHSVWIVQEPLLCHKNAIERLYSRSWHSRPLNSTTPGPWCSRPKFQRWIVFLYERS